MTPALLTKEVVDFLTHSGWRQFVLDEQFNFVSPELGLAKLCGQTPQTLANSPFLDAFIPADRQKLQTLLTQVVTTPEQVICTTTMLATSPRPAQVVEILLYLAATPGRYNGFVRPLLVDVQPQYYQKIEAVAGLSRRITAISNSDTLLDEVAQVLSRDFAYGYVLIFLSDLNETTLTLESIAGVNITSLPAGRSPWPIDNQTLIGQVASTGKPGQTSQPDASLAHLPVTTQSELAVPLVADQQVLGVLDVQSVEPDYYSPNDLFLLEIIASQMAIAIQKSRLFEERDRRMAELIAFNQIGIFIAEHSDLETIFSNTVRRTAALFQVEAASLLLLEKDGLRFVAAAGVGADLLKSLTLKRGQGLAWSVVESGKPVRVDDVRLDSRHFMGIDALINFTTRSLLAVPIQIQGHILGVIEVINRLDGRPFSQEDEITLEFIVSSVAIAIENTRLFGQIQAHVERVEGLLEASHALNTLDLQDILDTIVQRVSSLLKSDYTIVYLADYQTRTINPTAVHTVGTLVPMSTPAFNFDEGTVGWVLTHQQPLRINDVTKDSRFIHVSPASQLIVSLMSSPLLVKNDMIGVLEVARQVGGEDFTEDDESLLSAFASQAAVAIYNARLYRATQQQVRALTLLTEASESITKAADLDQLLNIVLESALSVVNAETGAILLVKPQAQILSIEASQGLPQEAINSFNQAAISQEVGSLGEVYRTGEIIEVVDANSNTDLFPSHLEHNLLVPFTNVPLFSRDEFIGIIFLHALAKDDSRSLLRAIADIAAVAIDKARLFQETNRRLAEVSTLYTLANQLTRVLDLERVTESSVVILKHALDCSSCCLFLRQEKGEQPFFLKACSGRLAQKRDCVELDYLTWLVGTLVSRPTPIYIHNVAEAVAKNFVNHPELKSILDRQPGATPTPLEVGSVMMMPLIAQDKVLGALSINDPQPYAFGPAEGRLLTIAAAQISTAIQNTWLYDNLEQRAIELETALKKVEEAHQLKTEFVENVSHELRIPLTFINAYVALILEGSLGEIAPTVREKLEVISQKTEAIIHLVEDLVSLQKIEAGHLNLEFISAHELITQVSEVAKASAAEHNITIVVNSSPDLPRLRVDVYRLGQVFDNLVGNALKFSPAGGKIIITARAAGNRVNFSVQDYGIGIPADKLKKVFDRFYQIDNAAMRQYGGAGLGLTIVKQIVEAHGGQIAVVSEVNKGTTFSFWLPVDLQTREEPVK